MKTFTAKLNSVPRKWYYIDANKKILGRLATNICIYLRGKHKVEYTPHIDVGDYIIVINAKKIRVTGKKELKKCYYHHTGFIGGIKKQTFQEILQKDPKKLIYMAVKGMLPKGPLGRKIIKKLKIYSNEKFLNIAQKPIKLDF